VAARSSAGASALVGAFVGALAGALVGGFAGALVGFWAPRLAARSAKINVAMIVFTVGVG
jgi:outer membrane lipoprotein SlyB